MNQYLIAILWIPFSFLLHNAIHELSHAYVVKKNGGTIQEIYLLPSKKLGRFTWAYVKYLGKFTAEITAQIAIAPMVAECFWTLLILPLFLFTTGALQKVLFVELISSNVDMINWLSKYWIKNPSPESDAEVYRMAKKIDAKLARRLSADYVVFLFIIVMVSLFSLR